LGSIIIAIKANLFGDNGVFKAISLLEKVGALLSQYADELGPNLSVEYILDADTTTVKDMTMIGKSIIAIKALKDAEHLQQKINGLRDEVTKLEARKRELNPEPQTEYYAYPE